MKKITWGIIGAGNIARTFAKDIAYTSNAKLGAVASRSLESANAFAQQYSIPKAYGSYAELYADPEIDAIYIATPHNFHLSQSLQALDSSKSVLCEKPLTVNSNECLELINSASQSSHSVMEALWTYFLPAIQKAQAWVAEGHIGKLEHIKAEFGFFKKYEPEGRLYNPELAGGCLLDMGIYPIALTNLFAQGQITKLEVDATFAPSGVEDFLKMEFQFSNLTAALITSYKEHLPNTAYIRGSEGTIKIPNFWSAGECILYQDGEISEVFNDGRHGSGFEFQIESFSQNILNGEKESSVMPLQQSLRLQELMDQVKAHLK